MKYESPELDILQLVCGSVITTSLENNGEYSGENAEDNSNASGPW